MGIVDLFKFSEELKELNLLKELEKNPLASQRQLSRKFGFALGLTNAYLKRMVCRGWVTLKETKRKKVSYFLTEKGLNEKARLTTLSLSFSIKYYTELKAVFDEKFKEMERKGIRRVVFYGVSDEMEVAYITIQRSNMELAGIVEDAENWRPGKIFGFELKKLTQLVDIGTDAVLITSFNRTAEDELKSLENMTGLKKGIFTLYI